MPIFERIAALVACSVVGMAHAGEGPGLGEAVSDEQSSAIDYTISVAGDGLPPGTGNAIAGAQVYAENCVACHGAGGQDGINDRLVGGQDSLDTANPLKTVGSYWPYATTIFDYVRRAMPYHAPGSLSNDELYAVTAYLLHLHGIIGEDIEMNALTLPQVKMPNRDNFVRSYQQEP